MRRFARETLARAEGRVSQAPRHFGMVFRMRNTRALLPEPFALS